MLASSCFLTEIGRSHNEWHQFFLNLRRVSPSIVMCDRRLVNCEACEWKYGDLRSGHVVISDEGWLE